MQRAWNLFQIRRALLTNPRLVFSFGAANTEVKIGDVQRATASILLISLVALLDEATATQMPAEDYERCGRLANRLGWLNKRGLLLDFDALDAVRDRRNDVGHEQDKEATVEELAGAVAEVERQLVAWRLVEAGPPYKLTFERTAMRAASVPGYHFEHDRIIRISRGDVVVYQATATVRMGAADSTE